MSLINSLSLNISLTLIPFIINPNLHILFLFFSIFLSHILSFTLFNFLNLFFFLQYLLYYFYQNQNSKLYIIYILSKFISLLFIYNFKSILFFFHLSFIYVYIFFNFILFNSSGNSNFIISNISLKFISPLLHTVNLSQNHFLQSFNFIFYLYLNYVYNYFLILHLFNGFNSYFSLQCIT